MCSVDTLPFFCIKYKVAYMQKVRWYLLRKGKLCTRIDIKAALEFRVAVGYINQHTTFKHCFNTLVIPVPQKGFKTFQILCFRVQFHLR
jgi:hypothetical protein